MLLYDKSYQKDNEYLREHKKANVETAVNKIQAWLEKLELVVFCRIEVKERNLELKPRELGAKLLKAAGVLLPKVYYLTKG